MTTITRAELLALARISHIDLTPEELDSIPPRLEAVLQYAAMVKELANVSLEDHEKNSNVMRADIPIHADAATLLAEAPEREAHYFVVPRILESSADSKKKDVQ